MSRMTPFTHPLLLGFDAMEKTLERMAKANDGYPPYNIERLPGGQDVPERLRITIAVAGFSEDDLDVTTADNQLVIRGRQQEQEKAGFSLPGYRCPAIPAGLRACRWHAGPGSAHAQRPSFHRSGTA